MRVLVDACGWTDKGITFTHCMFKGVIAPTYCDALIDPRGRFYAVSQAGHEHAAEEHGMTSVEQLEREGWLHFSTSYMSHPIVNEETLRPTQDQLDTLFDIVVALGKGEGLDINPASILNNHQRILNKYIRDGRDWS